MPIWLRNFTYRSIEEFFEKEREQQEKQSNKQTLTSNNKPKGPDIKPASYSTKARQ